VRGIKFLGQYRKDPLNSRNPKYKPLNNKGITLDAITPSGSPRIIGDSNRKAPGIMLSTGSRAECRDRAFEHQ
jgi:hypothetical protein